MLARPDPERSGAVEIATRRYPRPVCSTVGCATALLLLVLRTVCRAALLRAGVCCGLALSIHNGISIQICRRYWCMYGAGENKRPKKKEKKTGRFSGFGLLFGHRKIGPKSLVSVCENRKKTIGKTTFGCRFTTCMYYEYVTFSFGTPAFCPPTENYDLYSRGWTRKPRTTGATINNCCTY